MVKPVITSCVFGARSGSCIRQTTVVSFVPRGHLATSQGELNALGVYCVQYFENLNACHQPWFL